MPRFYFEKLVRDKVLDRCLDDPKVVHTEYRLLGSGALRQELVNKITEEGQEVPVVSAVNEEVVEEIADVQAVVNALCESYGITEEMLKEAIDKKANKNGGFERGAYIEYVDLSDDSEWVEILRSQPDKYREA